MSANKPVNTPIIKELSQQYQATLKMIGEVIVKCNEELWQDYTQEVVINQLVYHVLSSADLFLARVNDEENSFKNKYGNFNPPFNSPDKVFTKKQLLDYIEEIKAKAISTFDNLTFDEFTSGVIPDFYFSYTRYGILINNLRHLSHHIGALHARLTVLGNEPLPWVNVIFGDERDTWEEMSNLGVRNMKEGKLDEAEEIFLKITPKSKNAIHFYDLACVYSLQNKQEKALDTLKICFELDPNNHLKESAKKDNDFTNIRGLPAFRRLITS